ncbi:MAG: hypothetical protein IJ091_09695, partial [Oscillospiraceae bacterium]|nr:hypothetical protein [Oscillospiraceae bacterium]
METKRNIFDRILAALMILVIFCSHGNISVFADELEDILESRALDSVAEESATEESDYALVEEVQDGDTLTTDDVGDVDLQVPADSTANSDTTNESEQLSDGNTAAGVSDAVVAEGQEEDPQAIQSGENDSTDSAEIEAPSGGSEDSNDVEGGEKAPEDSSELGESEEGGESSGNTEEGGSEEGENPEEGTEGGEEVQTWTVTFYDRDAGVYSVVNVVKGQAIDNQLPATIEREDYIAYWAIGEIVQGGQGNEISVTGDRIDSSWVPTGDTVIVPDYDQITYTVSFYENEDDEEPYTTKTVNSDTSYCLNDIPTVPVKDGYIGKWVYSGGDFGNTVAITGDTKVWSEYDQTVFTVSFMGVTDVYEAGTDYSGYLLT